MSDLTAAQIVDRLKDTTAESWRWELAAATLIEQQAEQITHLNDATDRGPRDSWPSNAGEFAARWNAKTYVERDEWVDVLIETQLARERLEREVDKAESEVAALRKVIEDAPHEDLCDWIFDMSSNPPSCNCWKSEALPDQITT